MGFGSLPIHAPFDGNSAHDTRKEQKRKSREPFRRDFAHDGVEGDGCPSARLLSVNTYLKLLLVLLLFEPGPAFAQNSSAPQLITTFTNPTPAFGENFGVSVAAMGTDRVLVGTDSGAAAYLFHTSGTLLTTFTISDPAAGGFGNPVVAVGEDRVLISAFSYGTTAQNGRAYLFSTEGTLQTTFTNPNPARVQAFGVSVAALGSNLVLIGGVADRSKGPPYLGAVYLLSTNGALLNTFTNPTPAIANTFGVAVAAVGSDRVIIGAPDANTGANRAGTAYLFSTNGTLLTTVTNPVPVAADNFGFAVAAVGSDRVLIGAIADGGGASGGAAYLFSTNGTLITTFTNPTPAAGDHFGQSVAAVGTNRVLIGANSDDTGAVNAGAAYLFSTEGTLITTLTNPTPAVADLFGFSVAAVGKDQVLIGAFLDNTGATDAGAAYLLDLPYPPLSIARDGAAVSLKWTTPETGLGLQQADALGTSTEWSNVTTSVAIAGQTNVVQQPIEGGNTHRFFRLRRP